VFQRSNQTAGTYNAEFDGNPYEWEGIPSGRHPGGGIATPSDQQVYALLEQFAYTDNQDSEIVLDNLTPGAVYEVVLYFATWNDAGGQTFQFEPGSANPPSTVHFNQQEQDGRGDRRIVYQYMAPASGTLRIEVTRDTNARGLFIWALTNELKENFSALPADNITKYAATLRARLTDANLNPEFVAAYWAWQGNGGATDTNAWAQAGGNGTAVATFDSGLNAWVAEADNLDPATEYDFRFMAVFDSGATVLWTGPGEFTTRSDVPDISMPRFENGPVSATVDVRVDWFGGDPTLDLLVFYGLENHLNDMDDWLDDETAFSIVSNGCDAAGVYTFTIPYPTAAQTYYCRAFAINSSGTNATPTGAILRSTLGGVIHLANWVWTGVESSSWSDTRNWANASLLPPATVDDLQNRTLLFSTGSVHPPLDQDIDGLIVYNLRLNSAGAGVVIDGKPITVTSHVSSHGTHDNIILNDIALFAPQHNWSEAWNTLLICGAVTETNGIVRLLKHGDGHIHFYGPVSLSGGFLNTQGSYNFHGMETGVLAPGRQG
jgi:hypothetical protein